MKIIITRTTTALLFGVGSVVFAQTPGNEPGKEPGILEQRILGSWKGPGCDGTFLFRADRTYTLTGYGPAPHDSAGTWQVREKALPATLVLKCKTSEIPGNVGKTMEVKIVKLDDKYLAIEYQNQNASPPGRYTRMKK
jgi:hypothetical protein